LLEEAGFALDVVGGWAAPARPVGGSGRGGGEKGGAESGEAEEEAGGGGHDEDTIPWRVKMLGGSRRGGAVLLSLAYYRDIQKGLSF
jgi:hypothetical protein